MKKRCILFLMLVMLVWSAAGAEAPEVDLDLSPLSGNILLNRLEEIRDNPESYAGQTIRVRGKYFALLSGDSVRHTLIVCDSCQCTEIGIGLVSAAGYEIAWPENNRSVEITATVEIFETDAGRKTARLAVSLLQAD